MTEQTTPYNTEESHAATTPTNERGLLGTIFYDILKPAFKKAGKQTLDQLENPHISGIASQDMPALERYAMATARGNNALQKRFEELSTQRINTYPTQRASMVRSGPLFRIEVPVSQTTRIGYIVDPVTESTLVKYSIERNGVGT